MKAILKNGAVVEGTPEELAGLFVELNDLEGRRQGNDTSRSRLATKRQASRLAAEPGVATNDDAAEIPIDELRQIILDGQAVPAQDYRPRTDIGKTFFYLCERLVGEPINDWISTIDLKGYIDAQLKAANVTDRPRNPHSWFSQEWTNSLNPKGRKGHFRNEFRQVLKRSDRSPYAYSIRPKYFEPLQNIFSSLKL